MSKHPNRRPQLRAGMRVVPDVKFPCPICGLECSAGTMPQPFAAHAEPSCPTFDFLEVDEFLELARASAAEQRPKALQGIELE